jgi:alpha-ketoglutarate-dependent taurine dioxygenase
VRRESGSESELPLVLRPAVDGVNLAQWLVGQTGLVDELLYRHGALLFRGFGPFSAGQFRQIIDAGGRPTQEYTYRSTPRSRVEGAILTSTEYPASQSIPLHNEMSYSRSWPSRLWFACLQPAQQGGATPLADSRKVWGRIGPSTRNLFRERGLLYVRNHGYGIDLSWQEVFQTEDRGQVEAYCRAADIGYRWLPDGQLQTSQVCQVEFRHTITGEMVWFNQAHLFHVSALPEKVASALRDWLPQERWPRNCYFGDGSAIETEMLGPIRDAYTAETTVFHWEAGDVLLVDNLLVAHGRQPYDGRRSIVVAMTE